MTTKNYYKFGDKFIKYGKTGLPTYQKVLEFYFEVESFLKNFHKKYKFYIVGSFINYLHNKLNKLPEELDFVVVGPIDDYYEIKKILDFLLHKSFKFDFILDLHFENEEAFKFAQHFCSNIPYKRNLEKEVYIKNFCKVEIVLDSNVVFHYNHTEEYLKLFDGLYKTGNILNDYILNKIKNHMKNNTYYYPFDFFELPNFKFLKQNNTII